MTTDPQLADALDALTAHQRAAHDRTAAAEHELKAAEHAVATELADAVLSGADAELDAVLDRLALAREGVDVAKLLERGLADVRRRITPADRPAPPAAGDPRGIVTIRAVGRPGRHACNVPSTARPLEGGQVADVTFDDAVALCTAGHAEVVGTPPAEWPRTVAATGQQLAGVAVG